MFGDERSEHELEEPDPGAAAENPEFDVTTGEELVDRLPGGEEVPSDVRRGFWRIVLLLKFALLGTSFGLMLAYFWGWYVRGGALVAVGVLTFLLAVVRVRQFDGTDDDPVDGDPSADEVADGDPSADEGTDGDPSDGEVPDDVAL